MTPEIVRTSLLWIQVCVPENFTDSQVEAFANSEHPTGIRSNWTIEQSAPIRCKCEERAGCVHLVLNC